MVFELDRSDLLLYQDCQLQGRLFVLMGMDFCFLPIRGILLTLKGLAEDDWKTKYQLTHNYIILFKIFILLWYAILYKSNR